MPKKNNKKPRTALDFFIIKYKAMMEERGIEFVRGWKEITAKAAQIWEEMKEGERWIYEEEARKAKDLCKVGLENKFTSQGKSYAQVEREKIQAVERNVRMTQEIEGTVRLLDRHSSLTTYLFHLVHVNYYCQIHNGFYIPCEIALAEFNLVDGIRNTFHILINPGGIPLGYTFEARTHAEETHRIPMPPEDFGGEKDHPKILKNIKLFLMGQSGDESSFPPLYTRSDNIDASRSVLCKLQTFVDPLLDTEDIFRVYPVAKLFYELRNASVSTPGVLGFAAFSSAERELDKDMFDFTKGISCHFHEGTDEIRYCSLSCVRRWGYLIMKHCCKDLGINMHPGKHCPSNVQPEIKTRALPLRSRCDEDGWVKVGRERGKCPSNPPQSKKSLSSEKKIERAIQNSENKFEDKAVHNTPQLKKSISSEKKIEHAIQNSENKFEDKAVQKRQLANFEPLTPLRKPRTLSKALSLLSLSAGPSSKHSSDPESGLSYISGSSAKKSQQAQLSSESVSAFGLSEHFPDLPSGVARKRSDPKKQ